MRAFERGGERVEVAVAEDATLVAKWQADRECKRLIAEGWTQVAGVAVAATQPELLAALAADPDDLDTLQIYGDWLVDQGDPWGHVILVQHALATLPRFGAGERRDALERESTRLQFLHASRLWGSLGDIVDEATQTYGSDVVGAVWHAGFVRAAHVRGSRERIERAITPLAKLEIARFLKTLVLEIEPSVSTRSVELADTERVWTRSTCEAIAAEHWPSLETLELRSSYFERRYRHGPDPRTLDATWLVPILRPEVVPRLREFAVANTYNTDLVCTALATSPLAAQLTQLALIEGQFTELGIAALAAPVFPALQWLRLSGVGPATARTRLERTAPRRVIELRLDDDPDDEAY